MRQLPTDNLNAYDTYLRGVESLSRYAKESNDQARQLFERAIERDPQYADAYTGLSWTYLTEWAWWNQDPPLFERAEEDLESGVILLGEPAAAKGQAACELTDDPNLRLATLGSEAIEGKNQTALRLGDLSQVISVLALMTGQ